MINMTIQEKKSYTVKDWFANKVASEVGRSITSCDVFAILKETEKAVYGVLNLGTNFRKTMWIPKSVLVENEIGLDEKEMMHYETLINDNYDEVIEEFKIFWSQFI